MLTKLRHQDLRDIQARLKILGYDVGAADGYMGKRTITAIRDYQEVSGLPVTGKVSEDWVKRLDRDALRNIQMRLRFLGFDVDAIDGHMGASAQEAIKAFQEAEELPVTTELTEDWVKRLDHETLRNVQTQLQVLGYDIRKTDGYSGERTEMAIKKFQEVAGLPVTGKLSEDWLVRLEREALRNIQVRLQFLGYDITKADGHMETRTEAAIQSFQKAAGLPATGKIAADWFSQLNDETVRNVQVRLRLLGYNIGKPDGKVGPRTQEAINSFQKKMELPVTGQVSGEWYLQLDQATLRKVQDRLKGLRYSIGKVDGKMGPRTEKAIGSFQKRVGLPVTGKVSADWLAKLTEVGTAEARKRKQQGKSTAGKKAPKAPKTQTASRSKRKPEKPKAKTQKPKTQTASVDKKKSSKAPKAKKTPEKPRTKTRTASVDRETPELPMPKPKPRTISVEKQQTVKIPQPKTLPVDRETPELPMPKPKSRTASVEKQQTVKIPQPKTLSVNRKTPELPIPKPKPRTVSVEKQQTVRMLPPKPKPRTASVEKQQTARMPRMRTPETPKPRKSVQTASMDAKILTPKRPKRGGSIQVSGPMRFKRNASGRVIGCSVKNISLDKSWCGMFTSAQGTKNCKVILRGDSKVLSVRCT